jgi:hypothetical protein
VTIAVQAACYVYAVGPGGKGVEDGGHIDPPAAREAHNTHVGRILDTRCPGQVRRRVCTEMTAKPDDLRSKAVLIQAKCLFVGSLLYYIVDS